MVRHAQSVWNREGRFTGWADPLLTEAGRTEAVTAGCHLGSMRYQFDQTFTSCLQRAQETARIILQHSGNAQSPVTRDWRLNERHYGALQGMDKVQTACEVGEQQVWRWRRGYLDRPPQLDENDPRYIEKDCRKCDEYARSVPNGESLAETRERVMPFWNEQVKPRIVEGQRVFISSHGNTLRALIMALHGMSVDEVESFEIPTGRPIVYTFTAEGEPIGWRYLDEDSSNQAA